MWKRSSHFQIPIALTSMISTRHRNPKPKGPDILYAKELVGIAVGCKETHVLFINSFPLRSSDLIRRIHGVGLRPIYRNKGGEEHIMSLEDLLLPKETGRT